MAADYLVICVISIAFILQFSNIQDRKPSTASYFKTVVTYLLLLNLDIFYFKIHLNISKYF